MIEEKIQQRTDAWFKARCGIPTSSGFDKIITPKGEPSRQMQKYLYQLAGECVTGIKEESYINAAMQRGIDKEPEARKFYELIKGCKVKEAGICYIDKKKQFSCSPDGFVGSDGLVEIKCPEIWTHVGYMVNGGLYEDYFVQCQGQLFITRKKWVDVISYYPSLRPLIVRVKPDMTFITNLESSLHHFCRELDKVVSKIK